MSHGRRPRPQNRRQDEAPVIRSFHIHIPRSGTASVTHERIYEDGRHEQQLIRTFRTQRQVRA